jgi:hypothetical protein
VLVVVSQVRNFGSTRSADELKKVIAKNKASEIEVVLNDINKCIDDLTKNGVKLESFFNMYET